MVPGNGMLLHRGSSIVAPVVAHSRFLPARFGKLRREYVARRRRSRRRAASRLTSAYSIRQATHIGFAEHDQPAGPGARDLQRAAAQSLVDPNTCEAATSSRKQPPKRGNSAAARSIRLPCARTATATSTASVRAALRLAFRAPAAWSMPVAIPSVLAISAGADLRAASGRILSAISAGSSSLARAIGAEKSLSNRNFAGAAISTPTRRRRGSWSA